MKNIFFLSILTIAVFSTISDGLPQSSRKKDISKKMKSSTLEIDNKGKSSITEEEKKFVREIEQKFNVKSDEISNNSEEDEDINNKELQRPLPAVIAIEIVNDNSTDGKGKRTIDANLGYGYKTDHGYFYSHFGRIPEEKGKFMIYPYSQHDILPNSNLNKSPYKYHTHITYNNKAKGQKTHVEIQPSKAYQLVPVAQNEVDNSYKLDGALSHFRTKYEHIQSVQTPPPEYSHHSQIPTTLYSTFNGGQLSGLSGNFPLVMPQYFISPSQFLNQYQDFEAPGAAHQDLPQKNVVPVLILRIPSSQIQSPTAEFFPKLPHSHPYASSLNHINIQSLINQYLAGVQHQQYEVPTTPAPKYVYQYNQPNYYEPRQSYYMVHNQPQYQPNQNYEEPHQYVQEQQQEQPNVQYVLPHPTSAPHAYYTQKPHSYQQQEELPFSENYPDMAHTRVVYTQQYEQAHQEAEADYDTQQATPVKEPVYTPGIRYVNPQAVQLQTPVVENYEEKEAEEDDNSEKHSPSVVPPQVPYNYHAHPYPKREVKQKGATEKRVSMMNRRRTSV